MQSHAHKTDIIDPTITQGTKAWRLNCPNILMAGWASSVSFWFLDQVHLQSCTVIIWYVTEEEKTFLFLSLNKNTLWVFPSTTEDFITTNLIKNIIIREIPVAFLFWFSLNLPSSSSNYQNYSFLEVAISSPVESKLPLLINYFSTHTIEQIEINIFYYQH